MDKKSHKSAKKGNSLEDKHLAMVRMTSQSPDYESFDN